MFLKRRFRLRVVTPGGEFIRPLGRCSRSEALATAQRVAIYTPSPVTVRVQRGRREVATVRATFRPDP